MKKISMILMAVAIVTAVPMAIAQRHGGQGHMGMKGDGPDGGHPFLMAPWERIMEMSEEFNLSKDQLKAIYDVRDNIQEANRLIHKDIEKVRIDLFEIMKGTDAGQLDKALKLSDQIHNFQGKIRTNTLRAVFELKKILSAEQQEQIREFFREHREDRKEARMERKGRMKGSGRNCHERNFQEQEPDSE